MAAKARRPERRGVPLSRERIVEAAVELLDSAGESGLTFRALAERLATGSGAIYWHVSGKDELLSAATGAVLADAVATSAEDAKPQEAVRALAIGVFDAIDVHPWAGTQLARVSWQPPMLDVSERLGRQIQALGVPTAAQFTAVSTLMHYILGASNQNAANARLPLNGTRDEFLAAASELWANLDPEKYPFTRTLARPLREHDDRAEFLAGIDLLLAGMTTC